MSIHEEGKPPLTLIAVEAAENSDDVRVVLAVLGRMQLGPRIVREYEDLLRRERNAGTYPIDGITSTEQFLGKEHFLSFRDRYAPEFKPSVGAKLFYAATRPYTSRRFPHNLLVEDRRNIGLGRFLPEPYGLNQTSLPQDSRRAIRVDSFLQLKQWVVDGQNFLDRPLGMGTKTFELMDFMGTFLEEKITPKT